MLKIVAVLFLAAGLCAGADVTGEWAFTVETEAGTGQPSFAFKQDGEKLTGTYSGMLGKADVRGTVKGNNIEFEFEGSAEGQTVRIRYSGVIEGSGQMKGTVQFADYGSGTWKAVRK